MSNAEIDILMAVYNGEKYIIPQLQSIMDQTYKEFRLIIRDDGSTDNSRNLIEEFKRQYPDKIQIVPGNKNLGAKGNFSTLMQYAEAPYIMFADGDDFWLHTKIESTYKEMNRMEEMVGSKRPLLVHTDLKVVNRDLHVLDNSFWRYSGLNPKTANKLNRQLIHNVITGCTVMVNRPLLKLAQPIPEAAIMHDWWIGLVASAFGNIGFITEATMLYRQHGGNDIGAKRGITWKSPTSLLKAFRQVIDADERIKLRERFIMTIRQAKEFHQRYKHELDKIQNELVRNYMALGHGSALQKRYNFLKNGFYKNGLAKNIGTFFIL